MAFIKFGFHFSFQLKSIVVIRNSEFDRYFCTYMIWPSIYNFIDDQSTKYVILHDVDFVNDDIMNSIHHNLRFGAYVLHEYVLHALSFASFH